MNNTSILKRLFTLPYYCNHKTKQVILILITCLLYLQANAQERTLVLVSDNSTPTDSLFCRFQIGSNFSGKQIDYHGVYHQNKAYWSFTFPDSIYKQYKLIEIRKTNKISTSYTLKINNVPDATLYVSGYLFWEDADTLKLNIKYERTDTTQTVFNHYISEKYTLENPTIENLLSITCIQQNKVKYAKESDEDFVNRYKKLISQYPDSRTLISLVYSNYRRLSLSQLKELFNLFSVKNQSSYQGKLISKLLTTQTQKFQNSLLKDCKSGKMEPIITNKNKYTLVIFSASWCAPCHKLIPKIKELHQMKQEKIDFVYVSLDEAKTQESWKKMLQEQQIGWQSFFIEDLKQIQEQYQVPSIPYSYLVEPNGFFKRVDLRDDKDLKEIENL